jgi:DNA-directed RNA polymerase sigma subunit (sigma70/sigma32)
MRVCEHCGKRVPTGEQREVIRKLADGLRTVQEIADASGTTYHAAYQQIRKEELAARKVDATQRKWERFLFAAKQRAAGKTLEQIGAEMSLTKERVRQMVNEVKRANEKIGKTK